MNNTAPHVPAQPKYPPMLAQYIEYKERYKECALLFQVGDFYEIFFEDAITVSRTLNLTLTSRDKTSVNPVPMCGVPIAVVDGYIERLVAAGISVAVVSQTGQSADGKGMFTRALERIVTPGVRILGTQSDGRAETLVCAISVVSDFETALAYMDVQSGVVRVREGIAARSLQGEVARIGAAEILVAHGVPSGVSDDIARRLRHPEVLFSPVPIKVRRDPVGHDFSSRNFAGITGYSTLSAAGKSSVRMLLRYVDETTPGTTISVREIQVPNLDSVVRIDAKTRDNLELVRNTRDGTLRNTLCEVLDSTVTPLGSRLLRQWIMAPSGDLVEIVRRQDAVQSLYTEGAVRSSLRGQLTGIVDLERIAARLELGIVTPRELGALRDSLSRIPGIAEGIQWGASSAVPLLHEVAVGLALPVACQSELSRALVDSPPLSSREGGIFTAGYDAELDALRELRDHGTSWLAAMEARERERSGIGSLKIKYNNVIGYFIEVTKANVPKVPTDYVCRQDTVNALRYVTDELKKKEQEVLSASDKQIRREEFLFQEFKARLQAFSPEIRRVGAAVAQVDLLTSFAELAEREGYVRPSVTASRALKIVKGRHPVVSRLLRSSFVPNSIDIPDEGPRCMVLTGPNMGGKSTYLRQIGCIAIMAHCGSFVPAESAEIGIVDTIFARIGASDDLAEGESTFMVEMKEAGHIVGSATARSLVLIDEVGRGTATADGLAIAEAILEWIISRIECRTLFATHFHEITELAQVHPQIVNCSVGSVDRGGEVIFTHEICKGPASKSYGIEVAKLAGLPPHLIDRARQILAGAISQQQPRQTGRSQLPLFSVSPPPAPPADYHPLKELGAQIAAIDINSMTPVQALVHLEELVGSARSVVSKEGKR